MKNCFDAAYVTNELILSIESSTVKCRGKMLLWDAKTLNCLKIVEELTVNMLLDLSRDRKLIVTGNRYSGGISTVKFYEGKELPYAEFLGFNFNGSNFTTMSDWFRAAAKTFLLCCYRQRQQGGVLSDLPRDMRQLILVFLSWAPWQSIEN